MISTSENVYGSSPELQRVLSTARLAAATDVTLLVLGESGTGKELLAGLVHAASPRAAGPFVAVNCASLSEELGESTLWGHRRGAFTGAVADHPGLVRSAEGGTLFLDEVGELGPGFQARLLRFLECREVQGLGELRARPVDVRLIAATNRDLAGEVRAGRFREDLFYRLNVVPLELPPLRERSGDVPLLVERLTADLASAHGLPATLYSERAMELLERYQWPGNVRELRNLCERMLVLFRGARVEPSNLPAEIRGAVGEASPRLRLPEAGLRLADLEVDLIVQALERAGGNRSRAARLLGLTRDTLLYRLKKHGIAGG